MRQAVRSLRRSLLEKQPSFSQLVQSGADLKTWACNIQNNQSLTHPDSNRCEVPTSPKIVDRLDIFESDCEDK